MLLAMARDIRVILVKLADRLHNMRTLSYQPEDRQRQIAQETLDIYAPLANRLGISWIKSELEDLSFRYLEPEVLLDLASKVSKKKQEREGYIEEVQRTISSEKLAEHGIEGEVYGRSKHLWSIYHKMGTAGDRVRPGLRPDRFSGHRRRSCATVMRCSASSIRPGSRSPGDSRITSPCPRRTCTSRCTPR